MINCWLSTHSGKRFHPLAPRVGDVEITDIGYSLSKLCRFNGHVMKFYSVAEHCVRVSDYIRVNLHESSQLALFGLLHDAAEAYIGDMAAPLKREMKDFQHIEAGIMGTILVALGFPALVDLQSHAVVKWVDRRFLATEASQLLSDAGTSVSDWVGPEEFSKLVIPGYDISPWAPDYAAGVWLSRYFELSSAVRLTSPAPLPHQSPHPAPGP